MTVRNVLLAGIGATALLAVALPAHADGWRDGGRGGDWHHGGAWHGGWHGGHDGWHDRDWRVGRWAYGYGPVYRPWIYAPPPVYYAPPPIPYYGYGAP
jgi:hypothetical protein